MNFAYGVELGSSNSLATPQCTLLHGFAFKGTLILSHNESDEVVASHGREEVDDPGAPFISIDNLPHGFRALHLEHDYRQAQVQRICVNEG